MANLIIDTRERHIIPHLPKNFITKNLDVGDFLFTYNNEPILVIERKTYSDLSASIQGGRYKEQMIRLQSFKCKHKAYLIEGTYPQVNRYTKIPPSTLDSAILGLAIRDGFTIINSQSNQHTAELLIKILKKIPDWITATENKKSIEYSSLVKTVKKENLTPQVCYISQLCQIPNVGHNTAKSIIYEYNTLWSLMQKINTGTPTDAINTISEIKLIESGQRVGNILAKQIVSFLREKKRINIRKLK